MRPDISERVLGHVIAGVEGTYDRHSYAEEKRDALEKLAAMIGRILNPDQQAVAGPSRGGVRAKLMKTTEQTMDQVNKETKAYIARNAQSLARFATSRSSLLNQLRAQVAKKKFEPKDFDAEEAWRDLLHDVARLFIGFKINPTAPISDETARLSKLSSLLAQSGALMKHAMRVDIGALFTAWRDIENMPLTSAQNFKTEMAKFERNIAELEAIVNRAEKARRPTKGRPSGPSKLPEVDPILAWHACIGSTLAVLRGLAGDHLRILRTNA